MSGAGSDPAPRLGALLRRHRLANGLTQEELAERAGVSVQAIGALERGRRRRPRRDTIEGLAASLGLTGEAREALLLAARWHQPLSDGGGEEPDATDGGTGRVRRPAQLPPDIADFTGRSGEVARIRAWLTGGGGPRPSATAVPITVISGRGGVGKTVLGVHVAHQVRSAFGDGQLHAGLRAPDGRPVDPCAVLGAFLDALGVSPAAVPESLEERAKLFRTELAGRRVLVLLDDATCVEQVRPLLPGEPGCAVIVTTRSRLGTLAGAQPVDLDIFDPLTAAELLALLVGPERTGAEPETARAVARLCGHLPLAIRVAGSRLATHQHWPLAELRNRLIDERRRLDELAQGDLEVRASLAVSYHGLEPEARRAFRLLALVDAPDVPAWTIAAVLAVPLAEGRSLAERLYEARLLDATCRDRAGQVRYGYHDLVRLYARERAAAEDSAGERTAAVQRAIGGWASLARAAAAGLPVHFSPGRSQGWEPVLEMAGALPADRIGWFEAERQALVAAIRQATGQGLDGLALQLAAATTGFLELRGYLSAWREVHDQAIGAARRTGNRRAEAHLLWSLGELNVRQDRYDAAFPCYERATSAFLLIGDRLGEARCRRAMGYVYRLLGRHARSLACYEQARSVAGELGDRSLGNYALHGIGTVHLDRGAYTAAEACFEEGLEAARADVEAPAEARALRGLAMVDRAHGDLDAAVARLRRALQILRRDSDRRFEAHALLDLAALHRLRGRPDRAQRLYARCQETFEEVGDAFGCALVRQGMGSLLAGQGAWAPAVTAGEEAVRIFRERGLRLWEARALRSLARTLDASGQGRRAAAAGNAARLLFEEMGIDEAADRLGGW